MIKYHTLFIACCCAAFAQGQMLSPQVLASTGAYSSGGGYSLSYTVGEMAAVQTFTGGGHILTQGFQQPNDILIGILEAGGDNGTFAVYPVPATSDLWFGYEYGERGQVAVELYDMTGRRMDFAYTDEYRSGRVTYHFDCSAYASGQYLVVARFTAVGGAVSSISRKIQIIN